MGLSVADNADGLVIVGAAAPFCVRALAEGKHDKRAGADEDQQPNNSMHVRCLQSMIPKSGNRFSEKIMLKCKI
jgi:hypothetical protein